MSGQSPKLMPLNQLWERGPHQLMEKTQSQFTYKQTNHAIIFTCEHFWINLSAILPFMCTVTFRVRCHANSTPSRPNNKHTRQARLAWFKVGRPGNMKPISFWKQKYNACLPLWRSTECLSLPGRSNGNCLAMVSRRNNTSTAKRKRAMVTSASSSVTKWKKCQHARIQFPHNHNNKTV